MDYYSNEYCKRLNFSFDLSDIELDTSVLPFHNEFYRPQKYAIDMLRNKELKFTTNKTYELETKDKQKIIEQLPESLLRLEVPEEIGIMCMILPEGDSEVILPPHIDKVRKTAINFYLETSGGKTIYYDYTDKKLEEKFSFVAKNGETWLLNVDKPHSVKIEFPFVRRILTVSLKKTTYEEVIDHGIFL
jgi:hypothetical protein